MQYLFHTDPVDISCEAITTTDSADAEKYIQGHVPEYSAKVRANQGHLQRSFCKWNIGRVQFLEFGSGDGEIEIEIRNGKEDEECLFLILALTGSVHVTTARGRSNIRSGSGFGFESSRSFGTNIQVPSGCQSVHVRLPMSEIYQFLSSELQLEIRGGMVVGAEQFVTKEGVSCMLEYARWICNHVGRSKACVFASATERHFCQVLLSLVISNVESNYRQRYLNQPSQKVVPAYVRRAEEFMRSKAGNDITLAQVAKAVGVAPRTMRNGFQRYRNYRAAEFLMNERLKLAHQALMEAEPSRCSVTTVALSCGFSHLSRFAKLFQERYGKRPSDLLKEMERQG